MTGFAVSIWAFERTGSALVLSVSAMLVMLPKMLAGVFVSPFVDRNNKKRIMICADMGTGICTFIMFLLLRFYTLEIWHIFAINFATSVLGSFQTLASSVAVTAITPKKHYIKANGLQSLSGGMVQVIAPALAAVLLGFVGIVGIIAIDLATMTFACLSLAAFVKIPATHETDTALKSKFIHNGYIVSEPQNQSAKRRIFGVKQGSAAAAGQEGPQEGADAVARQKDKLPTLVLWFADYNMQNYANDLRSGFKVVRASALLFRLMLFMTVLNFITSMASYGLLAPMILARSGNSEVALAVVNSAWGLGGIAGALLILVLPSGKNKVRIIFICYFLSVIFGDVLFSLGSSLVFWAITGFLGSVFIPAITANTTYYWRAIVPIELQGRAFAVRYAIQSAAIPLGVLVGGFLADFVFEPFMMQPPPVLGHIFGVGSGAGMALMFFISGITCAVLCTVFMLNPALMNAEADAQ